MTGSDHPVTVLATKKFPAEERPGDWLIVARCGFDDVPMQLIKRTTKDQAIKRAKQIARSMVTGVAINVFGLEIDPAHIACLSVVKMSGKGVPYSCETVELGE